MTSIRKQLIISLAALLVLQGCAWLAGPEDDYIGSTLDDLKPARMPDLEATVPSLSIEEIEEAYHRALDVAENEEVRRVILVRLAGLEMVRSEQNQLNAEQTGQFFDGAISMYSELVELQAGRPGRDKLLYQLAKAYALDGRTSESAQTLDRLAAEYPNSPYIAEAQFRRAERAFSDGDYREAENFYLSVVQADQESPFYDNAIYMHGWSQFKNNDYEESLVSFAEVLDRREQDLSQQYRRSQAENSLRGRKFDIELENWLIEIREQAYVKVLI